MLKLCVKASWENYLSFSFLEVLTHVILPFSVCVLEHTVIMSTFLPLFVSKAPWSLVWHWAHLSIGWRTFHLHYYDVLPSYAWYQNQRRTIWPATGLSVPGGHRNQHGSWSNTSLLSYQSSPENGVLEGNAWIKSHSQQFTPDDEIIVLSFERHLASIGNNLLLSILDLW